MKRKILVAIIACAGLLAFFACSQNSSKLNPGIWLVDEGASYFLKYIIRSVPFPERIYRKPVEDSDGGFVFGSTTDKSFGLHFITSDSVTFLMPASATNGLQSGWVLEVFPKLNYKLNNDRFILRYNGEDILSVRYELEEKFTLFLDNGEKIVFLKSVPKNK
jgi:hypothetical protein